MDASMNRVPPQHAVALAETYSRPPWASTYSVA